MSEYCVNCEALAKRVEEYEDHCANLTDRGNVLQERVEDLKRQLKFETEQRILYDEAAHGLMGEKDVLKAEITRLREELNDLRLRLEASDE